MLKLSYRTFAVLIIFLSLSVAHGQTNKVVVIPLGGEDPSECSVTSCGIDGATLSCPSGEIVVPCEASKVVFVTSDTYNGDLGGLEGADGKCQALADAQPALTGKVFKAWLSDDTGTPSARFKISLVPYVLTNGVIVANDWAALTDTKLGAPLSNPISITESGVVVGPSGVFTNTNPEGTDDYGGSCVNWTFSGPLDDPLQAGRGASGGATDQVDQVWTDNFIFRSCSIERRLFCFEQ